MSKVQKAPTKIAVILFRDAKAWAAWLLKNHDKSGGAWLRIAKKGAKFQSISYDDALEGALSYGWIDAQKKSYDQDSWLQKFTPRGLRSIWSKINRKKAQTLIEDGQMKPCGMRAVERARENGQWQTAYDGQRGIEVPPDLQKELKARPAAKNFFHELNSVNRYAILHRIQMAKKPETRARRIRQFVEMLERHEKIYP
jgi:uncharacterized protein YdeI (YjbR/CyaY-like superfamily)